MYIFTVSNLENVSVTLSIEELHNLLETANQHGYPLDEETYCDIQAGEFVEIDNTSEMADALLNAVQSRLPYLLFDKNNRAAPWDLEGMQELVKALSYVEYHSPDAAISQLRSMTNCEPEIKEMILLYKVAQLCMRGPVFVRGASLCAPKA